MIYLEQNIKGLCAKHGIDFNTFLKDFGIDSVYEFTLNDLESIGEEYGIDLQALLFSPLFDLPHLQEKIKHIKLLILDVDGVMTDGGMYYTESGDQFKKFNTKDGLGIIKLIEAGIEVGIISSGFFGEAIKKRASVLGIKHCYVGREPKLEILKTWCQELKLELSQVGIIGDDINDLTVMQHIGFSACPSDAVTEIKMHADLILTKKGGEGCVREFISNYYLTTQNKNEQN